MAGSFQPKFADLVRNYTTTVGTGDFVLGPVVNGFIGFAEACEPGDTFYYSATGIDNPAQSEVGRGTLLANGSVSREPLGGIKTNFTIGTKSVALIAAAEWYAAIDAAAAVAAQAPTSAASRGSLAELVQTAVPALLTEAGREGLFVWDGSDRSTDVAADAAEALYVAPASNRSGTAGAWVRRHDGALNVKWFGAKGDGATDDTVAIQAALDHLNVTGGGTLYFPEGSYEVSSYLTLYPRISLRGAGQRASVITSSHAGGGGADAHENLRNGSVFTTINPINTTTRVNLSIRALGISNSNPSNVGAAFYARGGTFIDIDDAWMSGFKFGVVLDQSELANLVGCNVELQNSGGAAVWFVNGPDLTAGVSPLFTNKNSIVRCQINEYGDVDGIVHDGGYAASFHENNYNGCRNHLRLAGCGGASIRGGEFEGATEDCVFLDSTTRDAARGAGGNMLFVQGGKYIPLPGKASYRGSVAGPGWLVIGGGSYEGGGGTANPVMGAANFNRLAILGMHNGTGLPNADGVAAHHFDSDALQMGAGGSFNLFGGATGASVTQTNDKNSTVTINAPCGDIIMEATDSVAGGGLRQFTVLNASVSAHDNVLINQQWGGATLGAYDIFVAPVDGGFIVLVTNRTGSALAEPIPLHFSVIKSKNS